VFKIQKAYLQKKAREDGKKILDEKRKEIEDEKRKEIEDEKQKL
jgi:hypothetical protein